MGCVVSAEYLIASGSTLESFLFSSSSFICQIQKSSLFICWGQNRSKKCFAIKTSILMHISLFNVLSHVVYVLAWEVKTKPLAFSAELIITVLNGLVIELYQRERKEYILSTSAEEAVTELITQTGSGFRCLAKEFLCFSYLVSLQNVSKPAARVFEVSVTVNKGCLLETVACI